MNSAKQLGTPISGFVLLLIGCVTPWYTWRAWSSSGTIPVHHPPRVVNGFLGSWETFVDVPNWLVPTAAVILLALILIAHDGMRLIPQKGLYAISVYLLLHTCFCYQSCIWWYDGGTKPNLGIGCWLCGLGSILLYRGVRDLRTLEINPKILSSGDQVPEPAPI